MKRIHVNQMVIRHNKKYDNKLPAIRIEDTDTKEVIYCREVTFLGSSTMVYHPDKPLSCGAKLWIETHFDVLPIDPVKYSTIAAQMREVMGD